MYFYCPSSCVSIGVVSGNSEPQSKAWPDSPGPRTGLLPGDRAAESTRHPLQEWVREGNRWWIDTNREKKEIRGRSETKLRTRYLKKKCFK